MRYAWLSYEGTKLGMLREDGCFTYAVYSSYAEKMNMNMVMQQLELVREAGQMDSFDFDRYITQVNEFPFPHGWKFEVEEE